MSKIFTAIMETFGLSEKRDTESFSKYDIFQNVEMTPLLSSDEMERLFITDLYTMARDEANLAENEPVTASCFYFNMFYTINNERQCGWWMPTNHPIAQTMYASYKDSHFNARYESVKVCKTELGSVVCYTNQQIVDCVSDIVQACKLHLLPICDEDKK